MISSLVLILVAAFVFFNGYEPLMEHAVLLLLLLAVTQFLDWATDR